MTDTEYTDQIHKMDHEVHDIYWDRGDEGQLRPLLKCEEAYLRDYKATKRRFSDYLLTAAEIHGRTSDVYGMIEYVANKQLVRELSTLRDIMIAEREEQEPC